MKPLRDGAKVQICGRDFKFHRTPGLSNGAGEEYDGLCKHRHGELHVTGGLPGEYECVVTLHEIVHAILEQTGVGAAVDNEEAVCNAIAYGMKSVRVDGKPLV